MHHEQGQSASEGHGNPGQALTAAMYVSQALTPFDERALRQLERKAQATNFSLGVTGYLFFDAGRFVQYLEGEAMDVEEVLARIRYDSRHRILTTLRTPIVSRRFPNWYMKWMSVGDLAGVERTAAEQVAGLARCDETHPLEHTVCWHVADTLSNESWRVGRGASR